MMPPELIAYLRNEVRLARIGLQGATNPYTLKDGFERLAAVVESILTGEAPQKPQLAFRGQPAQAGNAGSVELISLVAVSQMAAVSPVGSQVATVPGVVRAGLPGMAGVDQSMYAPPPSTASRVELIEPPGSYQAKNKPRVELAEPARPPQVEMIDRGQGPRAMPMIEDEATRPEIPSAKGM